MTEHPEKSLECTECKRPVKVHYTEISGDKVTHTGMCDICPVLQRKLRGSSPSTYVEITEEGKTGLVCGECGTTLETIQTGNPVGCSVCYEIFGDIIFSELNTLKKIPKQIREQSKTKSYHIGRSPGEAQEISPSLRLLALNEALDETLKREDYEQAALLRDQIKALTEGKNDKKE